METSPDSPALSSSTSAFLLSAAVVILLNTLISCVKDAYAPLKNFLRSIAGHDWTTQGLFDLALFLGLGFLFQFAKIGRKIAPARLAAILIGSVVVASFGLAIWFALF